jgi:hypothetical protein
VGRWCPPVSTGAAVTLSFQIKVDENRNKKQKTEYLTIYPVIIVVGVRSASHNWHHHHFFAAIDFDLGSSLQCNSCIITKSSTSSCPKILPIMFAYSLLIVVVLVGTAAAFRAPVSSRCHSSKSSLAMSNSKVAPKVATG